MKLSDIVITSIIKKGVLYEARNVDVDIELPMATDGEPSKNVMINFKCDNMSLKIEKSES